MGAVARGENDATGQLIDNCGHRVRERRMSFADVRRNIVSAQLLTRLATEHGISESDCLHGSNISVAALASPQTEISAEQELQVVRNLSTALAAQPGIGLEAGSRYHLTTYGIWGYALASCPDYRSVSRLCLRYVDLSYAFVRLHMLERDGVQEITLDDQAIPGDVCQFLVERDFAALMIAGEEIRPGGFPVRAIDFRFPQPVYAERFRRYGGVMPRFGAPSNRIVLDAAFLDESLPQADAMVLRMCEEQCRQLLRKRQVRVGVSGTVRDRLLRAPMRMPDIEMLAKELCMSTRSLRRRLDEEQTSFRALVDEVRQTLAEELLVTAQMKLEEIAHCLGYSEPSSLIHAFKRWKGMSPKEFRDQQLAKASAQRSPDGIRDSV